MSGHGSIQIKGSWPLETPEMVPKRGFQVPGGVRDPILWLDPIPFWEASQLWTGIRCLAWTCAVRGSARALYTLVHSQLSSFQDFCPYTSPYTSVDVT